jgi:hypothetical protein
MPMLGIRTILGLEPKGEVLTHAENPVLPYWSGTITLEDIPGRWGHATVVAKGDDQPVLTTKEIYEKVLTARSGLGEEELAA